MERIPILYDSECRFCRATLGLLLAWDRHRRLRPVAIQSEEGAALLSEVPQDRRLASAHAVVPGEGRPLSGGRAAGTVLRELPAGAPLASLAERLPGAADRGYSWVAAHRVGLSRFVPASLKDRADRIVRERSD